MSRFCLAIGVTVFLAGCSHPAQLPAPHQMGDGLLVTLTSGTTAHTGDNTLTVTLADAVTGASVGNANITASPEMNAPVMHGVNTSGRAQGNGLYNIPVRLAIATSYQLTLHIERPGHAAADFRFPLEAGQ